MRLVLASPIIAITLFATCSIAHADLERKAPRIKNGIIAAPASSFRALSDIAEVEPNGSAAQAQSVGCGNSLYPASLANVSAELDSDWISLTANAGELITVETADAEPGIQLPTDTVLNLFASDGVTLLASNDDASAGSFYSRIADYEAPYTGLYYARIRGFNGEAGPYRANVSCAPHPGPPANDQCAGATVIPYGTINLTGTTRFATNDYDLCPGQEVCAASCTGFNSPGKDVVYRLNVAQPGNEINVTYDLDPPGTDASIYIARDCSNVQGTCVAGTDSDLGTPPENLHYVFPTSGTYYLILDAFTSGGAAWTLSGCLGCATAARVVSWGRLKTIYR